MFYKKLAVESVADLVFGTSPFPVTTPRGLVIGGGEVYPEINFTLPPSHADKAHFGQVILTYEEMVSGVLERAERLSLNGLVIEFETLIEMTQDPDLGVEIVQVLREACDAAYQRSGLVAEIRLTPNDLREFDRPPLQRTTPHLEQMFELFERGSAAGAAILSIESTGGKEISDEALMNCNIRQFLFSQAVLGVRDMQFLWKHIVEIAKKHRVIAGGDTACAFGNTAMVLAEKQYIPKIFAAIARVATVVRTLVGVEMGATGPDKDCGYEGPYLKAIAGIPISMEGKSAACAHLSPVGNVAGACADLWSNESVQHVKLLSDMAPTVYLEQLVYDTRLMNTAVKRGSDTANLVRDLMVESDVRYDPQALVLAPDVVIDVAREIVKGDNHVDATVRGCLKAVDCIEEAMETGRLKSDPKEDMWLDMIKTDLASIPRDESAFIAEMLPMLDPTKVLLAEFGIN